MSPRQPRDNARWPVYDEKHFVSECRLWATHAGRLVALGRRSQACPSSYNNVGLVHERLTAPRGAVSKSKYRQTTKQMQLSGPTP